MTPIEKRMKDRLPGLPAQTKTTPFPVPKKLNSYGGFGMRRKNRKWVGIAAVIYLFVMWSAYRWAIAQRPTDGNIFDRIEREGIRRQAEEEAKDAAAGPRPT